MNGNKNDDKIKCFKCSDIIEGDLKGTVIKCKCKSVAIDETLYYCRILGGRKNIDWKILKNKDDVGTEKKF